MINEKKYVSIISSPAEKTKEEVVIKNQDITITQNGVYEAEAGYTGLGIVNVAVPTPRYYGIVAPLWAGQDSDEICTPDFTGLTTASPYFCYERCSNKSNVIGNVDCNSIERIQAYGFSNCFASSGISGISFNNLRIVEEAGLNGVCFNCSNLTGSINFPALTNVYGEGLSSAFGATKITSASFPNVRFIGNNYGCFSGCFGNCSLLENISFNALTTISGESAFEVCFEATKLKNVVFPALATIRGEYAFYNAFLNCEYLESLSFPALTTVASEDKDIFGGMLEGVEGCTVHFPASLQATIGNWESVQNGFGGTNTVVLFDL